MKILVLPDIHGRHFWKEPCNNIETYDKVVFLGDYLDPYDFEARSLMYNRQIVPHGKDVRPPLTAPPS